MTAADVRRNLNRALQLDLIGPGLDDGLGGEVLDRAPTRWYLSGFLAPWNAPAAQKEDEEGQEELEGLTASEDEDDQDQTREGQAARRGRFPSSVGLSVLVPPDENSLKVTARWGDYEPVVDKDGVPTGGWQRKQRRQTVDAPLNRDRAELDVPHGDGL